MPINFTDINSSRVDRYRPGTSGSSPVKPGKVKATRSVTPIPSPQPLCPETGLNHIGKDVPSKTPQSIKKSASTPAPISLEKSEEFYRKRWEKKGVLVRICGFFNRNIKRNSKDMAAAKNLPKPPTFNARHVLASITDRALEDIKDFTEKIWRLLSLPLVGVAALKTYSLKKASQSSGKGKIKQDPIIPQALHAEKLQQLNQLVQEIDQLVDGAEADFENSKLKEYEKKAIQVHKLNKKLLQLDVELQAIAKQEGLKYSATPKSIQSLDKIDLVGAIKKNEFKERLKELKTTLKWYFAQALGFVASALRTVKHIPILGGLGAVLAYVADALKCYLEGKEKYDEFQSLMKRYQNKKAANEFLQELKSHPNPSKDLELIAKNIARGQKLKSESWLYGKQVVDLIGFAAIGGGLIVGAIQVVAGGALAAPVLAALFMHVSATLAIVALTMGAVYLVQRLIRWGVKLSQLARLEYKFQQATSQEEKLKIASRMLKKDGKQASFFLAKILQEENRNGDLSSRPVHDFLKKFKVFESEDWEILNAKFDDDDSLYAVARMMGKKLHIY